MTGGEYYAADEVGDVYRVPDPSHPYQWVWANRRSCQRASGVYVIRNRDTGRVYVGSSLNLRLRFTQHRSDLNNRNGRGQLQSDWTEYGEQRFMFIVLERIDNPVRGQLAQAEQVWLTYYAKLSSSPRPYNARLWVWRSDDGEMERYAAARRSKAAGQGGAVSADVWAVPLMSFDQIAIQPDDVWKDVSRELLNGWGGKCQDAVRLNRNAVLATGDELSGYWLTIPVARIANELGAPVQQLFTACALRRRPTTPPAEP